MLWPNSSIVILALIFAALSTFILLVTLFDLIGRLKSVRPYLRRLPLIVAFLLFLFGCASFASTKPIVCGSCHAMKSAIRDLSYTKHSSTDCMSCHKKANLLGLPIQNLSQASMLISSIRGINRRPVSAAISNSVCLECHNEIAKGYKTFNRIKISHKEMISENISCTDCHNNTAHQHQNTSKSMMEKCGNCHNGEKASARCSTCHQDKVNLGVLPTGDWSIAHGKNWPELHGTKGLNACIFCHERKYCGKCHKTAVPHSDGWSYLHSEEAIRNRSDCGICHKDESFCMACHKVEMPHPSNWLPVHVLKVNVAGGKVCIPCHKQDDCDNCHKKHKVSAGKMNRGIR